MNQAAEAVARDVFLLVESHRQHRRWTAQRLYDLGVYLRCKNCAHTRTPTSDGLVDWLMGAMDCPQCHCTELEITR